MATTRRAPSPRHSLSDDQCRQQMQAMHKQAQQRLSQIDRNISASEFARIQQDVDRWSSMTIDTFRERYEQSVLDDIDFRKGQFAKFIDSRGRLYADCRFDNFDTTCEEQQTVLAAIRQYADEMRQNVETGKSIVLFGPSGTGKDHLLTALARVAIMQYRKTVVWTSGAQLRSSARDRMGHGSDTSEKSIIDSLVRPDILILSDPSVGGASLTDFQSDLFYLVIDKRYSDRKPTWVMINCADREEMNATLGVAIADRLVDGALTMGCDWHSHREPLA